MMKRDLRAGQVPRAQGPSPSTTTQPPHWNRLKIHDHCLLSELGDPSKTNSKAATANAKRTREFATEWAGCKGIVPSTSPRNVGIDTCVQV